MAGVLFNFNTWEFTKGVFEVAFLFIKIFFLPLWWLWLSLFSVLVLIILIERWLYKRRQIQNRALRQKGNLGDLERLANLRDRGVITEEEFKRKKKEILG